MLPVSETDYQLQVVGESRYQEVLEVICGGRRRIVAAALYLEDENPYDPGAVRVEIYHQIIGYLDRKDALAYRAFLQKCGHPKAGRSVQST